MDFTEFGGIVQRPAIDTALQRIQAFETAGEEMVQTEITACEGNDGSIVAGGAPATVPQRDTHVCGPRVFDS